MAPSGTGPDATSDEAECLFSFELVVHNVKVDCASLALGERPLPTVAFRLLEFPTVLLYPRPGCDDGVEECESSLGILHVSFHRGKSCLFRQSLLSLHRLLSRTPLYILLLDLRARTPLLLGSCSLSLLEAITLLREGNLGMPAPCWRGDSGQHILLDLMGRNVGSISLSYRLLCLGGSVVGHMGLISGQKEKITMQQDAPSVSADPMAEDELGLLSGKPCTQHPSAGIRKDMIPPMFQNQTRIPVDDGGEEPLAGDTHPGPTHQQNQPTLPMPTQPGARQSPVLDVQAKLEELEHETNVHCPPLLYYRNDNDHKPASEKLHGGRVPKKHIVVEVNESNNGEQEENHLQREDHGTTKPKTDMVKARNEQQKQDVSDISTKPILSQLPLLTTLLQELSILNGQLPISVETISSRLAWQYTNGKNSEIGKTKSTPLEKSRRKSSPKSKRNKGETVSRPSSALSLSVEEHEKNEEHVQIKTNVTKGDAPSKRKLYYGLTNTFRLRLQQTNPSGLLEHERRERHRREQVELLQQKKSRHKGLLSKTWRLQSASGYDSKEYRIPGQQHKLLDENIETLIQHNAMKAKDIFFLKQEHQTTLSPKIDRSEEKSASKPVGPLARNLKINLPRSSLWISDQDNKPNSPSIPGSALSGTYRQNSRNSLNSPNGRISREFLDSQDYTGYSDDFTSVDFTSRNSDAFDSSPEPGPMKDLVHSDSERSVSSPKYNSATPSLSTPQPAVLNASPVQSYEMDMKYKKNPQIKIPLSVPYDDLSEEYKGNEAERSKSVYESSIDSENHRQREYSSLEDPSESEPYSYSYENNHSGQASKTDMSTFKSDGDLSALESSSNQHFKTDTSDHGEQITHNQYKHISELQLKTLPGYTL